MTLVLDGFLADAERVSLGQIAVDEVNGRPRVYADPRLFYARGVDVLREALAHVRAGAPQRSRAVDLLGAPR